MPRLHNYAYEILSEEIKKLSKEDLTGEIGQKIVLKRLEKLRMQSGEPAKLEELRELIVDQYPTFSEKVLKKAARENHPAGKVILFQLAGLAALGVAGLVWVANLPFPMVRRPVARVAPMVLLPSYISMDRNYREAIAKTEQADQLINKATSSADINLGTQRVAEAQKHLDGLPVWFLGYYPQRYCTFFSCTWRFTLDEFERARKRVGQIEAKAFQEKNAQTLLKEAEQTVKISKQQYQQATTPTEKEQAIAEWQVAIDKLEQIPPTTLAGKMVKPKLAATKRDFKKEASLAEGSKRSFTLMEVAKKFGFEAAKASQNAPHSEQQWQLVASLWEQAISQLQKVSVDNPSYLEAQTKLAEYQVNLANVKMRLQLEKQSGQAFKQAKNLIADWQRYAVDDNSNQGILASTIQSIINQLENVKPGTTYYQKAQELLKFAKNKQKNL
ncbi:MAG: hypothetical protein F6K25_23625 [Okeania sp. SIO2G4]|uniref:hypothetical protein n=1 Tax=unclassified Okeania TaxID=2634635 RepID=UPI0013B96A8F|nr:MULTISPECIES: hypothetical protein [unclassified Okeania]NEP72044.1 hypothetical protein [Okeania sp. SIO2G5]NEP93496.1 hypothetical protein [Okeania sp. SIO2F5]NEQ93491.1 hypothetical protein [Okeania sp. SIO2G4]